MATTFTPNPTIEEMYSNIECMIDKRNLTQQQFADRLGIAEKTYRNFRDEKRDLSGSQLIAIAELLDCSLDFLLGLSDKMHIS